MFETPDFTLNDDRKGKWQQGKFHPRNPEKYLGDLEKIVFRSSWELEAFRFLDRNPNILHWISEGIPIPYLKPVPPSVNARGFVETVYYPDLFVVYRNKEGEIVKEMVEIKPLKQTRTSRARNQSTKLQENYTYAINKSKWEAAKIWCAKRGIKFSLATEKSIFKMKC
jgi:hypothetical protein